MTREDDNTMTDADTRYRDISEALPDLASLVMEEGEEVDSRNGRTMELLYPHVTLTEPWRREVLVPGRKASLPAQIAETMWILAGRNDIEWLSRYLPRAAEFSDDGKTWRGGYGPRIRGWWYGEQRGREEGAVDQLAHVVELLRSDPLSRRAVISIYDPGIDTVGGKDVPCNNWLHFVNRLGHLDLHVATRSNDLIWGWSGINAFEWSALQEIVAGLLGVRVGELHFSISSLHVYDKHWDRARKLADAQPVEEGLAESPRFDIAGHVDGVAYLDSLIERWFAIEANIREDMEKVGHIHETTLGRIGAFPEPMLQSWLMVLAWHWDKRERDYLEPLFGTRLGQAALWSPEPKPSTVVDIAPQIAQAETRADADPFTEFVVALHAEKHAAYGDSWKRRGEMLGILANIARKVDRLGGGETRDETSADTAIDLLVYLVKYRLWLTEFGTAPSPFGGGGAGWDGLTDHPENVAKLLGLLDKRVATPGALPTLVEATRLDFDALERRVMDNDRTRYATVDILIKRAARVARRLWEDEQIEVAQAQELAEIDAHRHPDAEPTLAERNATRFWGGYDSFGHAGIGGRVAQ